MSRTSSWLSDERVETEAAIFRSMEPSVVYETGKNPVADFDRKTEQPGGLRKRQRRSGHLIKLIPDTVNQRPPGAGVAALDGECRAERFEGKIDDLRESRIGRWWLLHLLLR